MRILSTVTCIHCTILCSGRIAVLNCEMQKRPKSVTMTVNFTGACRPEFKRAIIKDRLSEHGHDPYTSYFYAWPPGMSECGQQMTGRREEMADKSHPIWKCSVFYFVISQKTWDILYEDR